MFTVIVRVDKDPTIFTGFCALPALAAREGFCFPVLSDYRGFLLEPY